MHRVCSWGLKINSWQLAVPSKSNVLATAAKQFRTQKKSGAGLSNMAFFFASGAAARTVLSILASSPLLPPPRGGSIPAGPARKEIAKNCAQNAFWHFFLPFVPRKPENHPLREVQTLKNHDFLVLRSGSVLRFLTLSCYGEFPMPIFQTLANQIVHEIIDNNVQPVCGLLTPVRNSGLFRHHCKATALERCR